MSSKQDTGVPQDLVDKLFDRELDEGSREKLFGMLRSDLSRCAEVAKTQRMVSMLREPIPAPDLTARVMARVGRRRGFLPERLRRMVTVGRLAAAACVLLGVLVVALVERASPDTFRLVGEQRPLSGVIESSRNDAAANAERLAGIVALRQTETARPDAMHRRPLGALTPGRTSIKPLARPSGESLAIAGGAGQELRFIFAGGVCVDQRTSAAVAVAAPGAGGTAVCPDDLVAFIQRIAVELRMEAEGKGNRESGPSAAGRRSGG